MNLDDLKAFEALDRQNLIEQINGLPDQMNNAWELGQSQPLPEKSGLKQILIAGMGGSAIGPDLLAAYVSGLCPLPVIVHRDYNLPAWATGPETLVIALSHSGNTEETLTAFEQARSQNCRVMAVTTGGQLEERARAAGVPVWKFDSQIQPRTAAGFTFTLLLALLYRLGLIADPASDLDDTLHALRNQQTNLLPAVPISHNPAKRMAGQLMGRWVTIFAAGSFAPVARRWKGQISENAKAWAQFEFLPEADHNTLAGLNNPEPVLMQTIALFLQAPSNHPRDLLRLDYTRQIFMGQGINTDVINAKGRTPLAHLWTLLHFGDYTSYYLAMAYGEDPTPVEIITMLKAELDKTK